MQTRLTLSCVAAACVFALSGCGGPKVYEDESFAENSAFEASFMTTMDTTCEAARRTLLSQGYSIVAFSSDAVRGVKVFQPDEDIHMELEFNVVCASTTRGTLVYANAIQTQYELKDTSKSAGLSVSGVGSLSLPWGSRGDTLSKVGAETVSDPEFYTRFFRLMERHAPRFRPAGKAPRERVKSRRSRDFD